MQWEKVDLAKGKPVIPGLIDLDLNGSSFISATFKTPDGLFRIRHESYSVTVEKQKIELVKVFTLKVKFDNAPNHNFSQDFKTEAERDDFRDSVRSSGIEFEELSNEIPVPRVKHDEIPF